MRRKSTSGFGCAIAVFGAGAAAALGGVSGVGMTPLNDLGTGFYNGFQGGLYPGGVNTPPAVHLADAMLKAGEVVPRNGTGAPDPNGWIVMVSIGMSNTCHEFAVFERQEDANPNRNAKLIIVNGAVGGQTASAIANPAAPYWQVVNDRLTALGLTPQQVQVIWLKEANAGPANNFPTHAADLKVNLRSIAQNLYDKFPNTKLCYLSSRIFGGYAPQGSLNPEPQAFESGFSVKWLIEDQIGGLDPGLNYGAQPGPVEAPLLLWGAYLWADGTNPRSDGLVWLQDDIENDGAHPAPSGEQKVANLLSQFFASEPTAQTWFAAQPGHMLVALDAVADAYVSEADPNANFGTQSQLLHQGAAPRLATYLRFDVSGAGAPIAFAKLNLRVPTNGLGGSATLGATASAAWGETAITWANAPEAGGGVLAQIPQSSRDGSVSANATSTVIGDSDGLVSLVLNSASGPQRAYHSREAGQPPRLVLVVQSSGPPIPAASSLGLGVFGLVIVASSCAIARRRGLGAGTGETH